MVQNHHGVTSTTEIVARPAINTTPSPIVLIGTAGKGPLNTPTLCNNLDEVLRIFGRLTDDEFSIPKDAYDIYQQTQARVIIINVADATDVEAITDESTTFGSNNKANLSNGYVSLLTLDTNVSAPAKFAPDGTLTLPTGITGVTNVKSADGLTTYVLDTDFSVAANVITNLDAGIASEANVIVEYTATLAVDVDFSLDSDNGILSRISTGKLLYKATVSVDYSRVDASSVTATEIIGTNTGGTKTGAELITDIPGLLNISLNKGVLLAPDFTHQLVQGGGANPVTTKLLTLANTCGTIVVSDTPNTNKEDAVTWAFNNASERIYAIGLGFIKKSINGQLLTRPSAASVAGVIAGLDALEGGVANSPSNRTINGVEGLAKPASFSIAVFDDSANTDANFLNFNDNAVATIVNNNGYKVWGNYSTSDSGLQTRFINVKRALDETRVKLAKKAESYVDRNISSGYVDAVTAALKSEINTLIGNPGKGLLLSGDVWPASADKNTPESLLSGRIFFNVVVAIASPAQQIILNTTLQNGYLTEFTEALV